MFLKDADPPYKICSPSPFCILRLSLHASYNPSVFGGKLYVPVDAGICAACRGIPFDSRSWDTVATGSSTYNV